MNPLYSIGMATLCALCVTVRGQVTSEIVGGRNAAPGEYPWMVALVSADDPDNFEAQFCGGTLVHPSWVVTAAHCMAGETAATLQVIVGGYDLDDNAEARIAVDAIVVHPDYNWVTFDSDIALLHLATPSDAPWIPMISDSLLDEAGLLATIVGWGATNRYGFGFPSILQETEIPIVSNAVANQPLSYGGEVTTNMLAAGNAAGGEDTCGGDSGGPLVTYNPDIDSWVLTGVTSWGDRCGDPLKYGVYTRVYNFRYWALGHMLLGYRSYEDVHGVRGRLHDPDLDGYPNLLEYAHNSNPTNFVAEYKPGPALVDIGGSLTPALRYRRLSRTTQIFYHPEVSRDQGLTWLSVDPVANQVGDPVYLNNNTDMVTVRDPAAPGAHDSSLLRVRISLRP